MPTASPAGTNEAFIMTAGDRAVLLNYFNIKEIAGPACRLRIGDLDGDGRNDILAVNTAQNTSDGQKPPRGVVCDRFQH